MKNVDILERTRDTVAASKNHNTQLGFKRPYNLSLTKFYGGIH
jgi:hypothetical protein